MKLLLFSLVLLSFACLPAGRSVVKTTHAQSPAFSVSIYPPLIEIEAQSPANVQSTITLENKSESKVSLNIQKRAIRLKNTGTGELTLLRDKETPRSYSQIFNVIKFLDGGEEINEVNLNPLEKKEITLLIPVTSEISPRDYYFSILFVSKAPESDSKSVSQTAGGVASNVILNIGGKSSLKAAILSFDLPLFVFTSPIPITLLVENEGNNYILPRGRVSITDMFGHDVGRVDILPQYILSGDKRYLTDSSFSNNKEHNVLMWSDKLIFGKYDAKVVINLSDKGPTYSRVTTFYAIPLFYVITIVAFTFILLGIYFRVKSKISRKNAKIN